MVGPEDSRAKWGGLKPKSRIAHPNVVGVYDIGTTEQCSYLVMELLRGESLAERLRRQGRLAPDRRSHPSLTSLGR